MFHLIVAIDQQCGIGVNGILPWNLPEDLIYFKNKTTQTRFGDQTNAVIMGKNTWFSIPEKHRPLRNRLNVILSSTLTTKELMTPLTEVFTSLNSALEWLKTQNQVNKIFVIGGKRLYQEALHHRYLDKLYITQIKSDFGCDTFLDIDLSSLINQKKSKELTSSSGIKYHFCVYRCKSVNSEEHKYLDLLDELMTDGDYRKTRNAMTFSKFGKTMTFDLSKHFPLLTTKKVFLRGVFEELLFFLRGQTDSKILEAKKVNIWKPNTTRQFLDSVGMQDYPEGDMGAMYGFQLRHYGANYINCKNDYTNQGYDQIENVLHLLKNDPTSRRIMMTTYCPTATGVLNPCHGIVIQFYTNTNYYTNELSCNVYQRSCDVCCGLPFNIASYSLLVYLMAEVLTNTTNTKWKPGKLTMMFGDIHIYESHCQLAKEQTSRQPYLFPQLEIVQRGVKRLEDFVWESIKLVNYRCYPALRFEMIV